MMVFFNSLGAVVRGGALAVTTGAVLLSAAAPAAAKDARLMVDWLIQGTHAPFFLAQSKGYYKAEDLNVTIDSGKGATNVAVSVAGGAYQFGLVDMPSMVMFNAKNPTTPLVAVYMYFDETPLAVVSRKSAGIEKPTDLMGKKIAGGPGTAVHDTITLILSPQDNAKVQWLPVAPQLFGAMLKRGEADGLGGFINSQVPAALEAGLEMKDISVLKYADFGADLYGMALVTTKAYADANPDVVRGMVKAINHGVIDTLADPDAALAVLKSRDAMMKMDIEKVRLGLALSLVDTPYTQKNGLSTIVPARMQKTIDMVAKVFNVEKPPTLADTYTDAYLPPLADRMPKAK